jgi:hypothetical protein
VGGTAAGSGSRPVVHQRRLPLILIEAEVLLHKGEAFLHHWLQGL